MTRIPASTLAAVAVCAIYVAWAQGAEGATDSLRTIAFFADHPLVPLDQPGLSQLAVVGRLERPVISTKGSGVEYGSAVVVSPCYIITNHHVAYGDDVNGVLGKDYSMIFRAGVGDDPGGFFGHTTAHPVIAGDYANSKRNDWAIMRLDRCAGALNQIGWVEQSKGPANDLLDDQTIALVGFTPYRDPSKLQISSGNFTGFNQSTHLWKSSASVAPGESGGGVFIVEDGELRIVGLTVGHLNDDRSNSFEFEHYNDAEASLFLSSFEALNRPDVKKLLDDDKALHNYNNPATKRRKPPF